MVAASVSLAAVVVAGAWFVRQRHQPATAERLLALAYAQRRTLEPRIAGAACAPLRVSRGPEASFTKRSPALLKAEALIAAQLKTHPSDPAWLQASAQADLLEGSYDAAVEALQRGLEIDPQSSALLIDLATAYFQRAQQEDHKEDLGAAYEYLSRALKLHPDDPVALFNRAIVAEHEFLYHQALEDWERYLQLDSSSQWAEEAHYHADAVREKLKARQSEAAPLLTPAEVAAKLTNASLSSNLASEVDSRVEQYLHEAVVSWLPRAFPDGQDGVIKTNGSKPDETSAGVDPQAARALFFLADLTSRLHGDQWLTDVLRGSSAYRFPQAASALALAVRANDTGQHDIARQQGQLAAQLFRASGNLAGSLRALGRNEEAVEAIRSAIVVVGDAPELRFNCALSLFELGRLEEAKEEYLAMPEEKGDKFTSYDISILGPTRFHNLAVTCLELGQYSEARLWWLKTLDYSPLYHAGVDSLFRSAIQEQDFKTARQVLDRVRAEQGASLYWTTMSCAYHEALGGEDEGMNFLARTVNSEPLEQAPREVFARRLLDMERFNEALPHLNTLQELGNADAAYNIGVIASRTGQTDVARRWMEAALSLDPEHPEAEKQLAAMSGEQT